MSSSTSPRASTVLSSSTNSRNSTPTPLNQSPSLTSSISSSTNSSAPGSPNMQRRSVNANNFGKIDFFVVNFVHLKFLSLHLLSSFITKKRNHCLKVIFHLNSISFFQLAISFLSVCFKFVF